MPPRIEDYALIGDTHTAALVSKEGSIDWLCLPRFDSPASFAALVGNEENGRWQIAPYGDVRATRRRYRGDTLVLETDFDTAEGSIRLVDFMPPRGEAPYVVRLVEGVHGRVPVHMDLRLRFDYGRIRPWLRHIDGAAAAIAGPDCVWLRTPVETREEDAAVRADFFVSAGEFVPFVLFWHPSHEPAPAPIDPLPALADTESFWTEWISSCAYKGEWREAVVRSVLTLKALIYAPTGGIVAAPTTSLPEQLGGVRNWDYRYCWLRDAAFTLLALTRAGFRDEARAWHSWLLRVVAGDPADLQAVYAVAGERRLTEVELPWLAGYQGSKPVRIGNEAAEQLQLDVYGQVVNAMHHARRVGLEEDGEVWSLTRSLVDFVDMHWRLPDEGLWEVRGPRRHFVNSKVMAWVAVDRALSDAEEFGLPAPVARWRTLRQQIYREVLTEGYDANCGSFTQSYGSKELDASALLLPLVGFLPASDECMRGTVAASASSATTASSTATRRPTRRTPSTGFPRARAPSSPAASGSPPTTRSQAALSRRERSSSACSRSETTLVCWPRSTTPLPGGSSATSPRPSATCRSSWPRTSSARPPSEDWIRSPGPTDRAGLGRHRCRRKQDGDEPLRSPCRRSEGLANAANAGSNRTKLAVRHQRESSIRRLSMRMEQTFFVSQPPEVVFDYLTNPSNLAEWQTSKTSVEQLTDGSPQLGTRVRERTKPPGGKEFEQIVEFSEFERPVRVHAHIVEGPYPIDGTWSFEPDGDGTRVHFVAEGELRGVMRVLQPVAKRVMARQMAGYHRNLRRNVEGDQQMPDERVRT